MPPFLIVGADSKPELVNSRVYGKVRIVDRLFAAAELRLGGESQQIARIVRTDGRPQRFLGEWHLGSPSQTREARRSGPQHRLSRFAQPWPLPHVEFGYLLVVSMTSALIAAQYM